MREIRRRSTIRNPTMHSFIWKEKNKIFISKEWLHKLGVTARKNYEMNFSVLNFNIMRESLRIYGVTEIIARTSWVILAQTV